MGQCQSLIYNALRVFFAWFLSTPKSLEFPGTTQGTQATIHSFSHAYFLSFLRRVEAPPPSKVSTIPSELLLHIFSFLELRPYILAHGVCTEWKRLLPLADMHPTRRRFLALYHRILQTPNFAKSLEWSLQYLQPFDRQNYIDKLLAQYPVIPEEFRMWILEWPEKLVIRCMWPALPFVSYRGARMPVRWYGVNWLSHRPSSPTLVAPLYAPKHSSEYERVPCPLVWRYDAGACYLVFDSKHASIFGRVYITGAEGDDGPHIIPNGMPRDPGSDNIDANANGEHYAYEPSQDWICFLEERWDDIGQRLAHSPSATNSASSSFINVAMEEPVSYDCIFSMYCCPAPLWDATLGARGEHGRASLGCLCRLQA